MTQILDKEEKSWCVVPQEEDTIDHSTTVTYDFTIPDGEVYDCCKLTNLSPSPTDPNMYYAKLSICSEPCPGQAGPGSIVVCLHYNGSYYVHYRIQAFSKVVSDVILGDDGNVSITGDTIRVYPMIVGGKLQMDATDYPDEETSYPSTLTLAGGSFKVLAGYERGHDESSGSVIELTSDKLRASTGSSGAREDEKTSSIDLSPDRLEVHTQLLSLIGDATLNGALTVNGVNVIDAINAMRAEIDALKAKVGV